MGRRPTGSWDPRTGRWFARLGDVSDRSGKRRRIPLLHQDGRPITDKNDRGAVRRALDRILAERTERQATHEAHGGPTVAEVVAAYLRWQVESKAAAATVRTHAYNLERWCNWAAPGRPATGDRSASTIHPADLWAYEASGIGGVRHAYLSILACWRWAARPIKGRHGTLIPANPLAGMERPAAGRRAGVLPWPTARRLLRFARARPRHERRRRLGRWGEYRMSADRRHERGEWLDRKTAAERLRVLCLALIAHTGCRPKEAVGLRWDEVRWESGVVVVDPMRDKGRRRGVAARKPRIIAVPGRLLCALRRVRDWPGAHPTFAFLPAWSRGKVPSRREYGAWFVALKDEAVAAGIAVPEKATLYWLRHEFQSGGIAGGISAERLALAAGNSPGVLLGTYTHAAIRDVKETYEESWKGRRKRSGGERVE